MDCRCDVVGSVDLGLNPESQVPCSANGTLQNCLNHGHAEAVTWCCSLEASDAVKGLVAAAVLPLFQAAATKEAQLADLRYLDFIQHSMLCIGDLSPHPARPAAQ